MNKKRIIISTIVILLLSTLFHSVYDKFPNAITLLFFPVNESIWEHNKMILLSYFILALIEKVFIYKDKNVFFTSLIEAIICIILLDLTFTPIYLYVLKTKDNLVLTLIIFAISIFISFIVGEKLLKNTDKKETPALLGFALVSSILILTTFYPPHLSIFYDYREKVYGISNR